MDTVTRKLTTGDLVMTGLRLLFIQGLLHTKGMQSLGLMNVLSPALSKLSPNAADNSLLRKHLGFFNCNPNFAAFVVGGILRLEEQRLEGRPIGEEDVNYFKKAVSSPLAAMGDMLFLGALKPLALTLACVFAIYHSFIGLLATWLLYNLVVVSCRLWGVYFGYVKGWELVDTFSGPAFQRLLGIVQTIGASAGGALVAVVLHRLPQGNAWMLPIGVAVAALAVFSLKREVSSTRFAILLFPISLIIASILG